MRIFHTTINTLLNIVFPSYCISCGKAPTNLCIECISDFPRAERESAKWIFPLYDYRHPPIKKALWLLKYKGRKKLADTFAGIMYHEIIEELSDLSLMENFRNPILIPIPLSKGRYRERGYNQTELICEELIKLDENVGGEKNFSLEKNILVKINDAKHQAHIENRRERLKNIIGSFSIKNIEQNKILLKNRNVILIDDITTTGATLSEAKKILKQASVKKVIAFTVAH